MDFLSVFSIIIYIVTVFIGLRIDQSNSNKKSCKLYEIWLYIFLCFGYMTGSDWRGYEIEYGIHPTQISSVGEYGFYCLYYVISTIIPDYWVAVGLMKCIYLYSLLQLFKRLSSNYLSLLALSLPIFTCFILIDNPLRFMCALVFVNISTIKLIKKKYIASLLFIILSFFFHNTAVFFVLLFPAVLYAPKIAKVNGIVLIFLFVIVLYITSNMSNIQSIVALFMRYTNMLDIKDYTHYLDRNTDGQNFFSVGSFIQILYFVLIVISKNSVIKKNVNGELVSGLAIFYMFLQRFTLMIPTGFRLTIPFAIFYCLYIVMLKTSRKYIYYFFLFIILFQFGRKLYSSYLYIPYTNSIPYIITEHKSYNDRYFYNYTKYRERFGHDVQTDE